MIGMSVSHARSCLSTMVTHNRKSLAYVATRTMILRPHSLWHARNANVHGTTVCYRFLPCNLSKSMSLTRSLTACHIPQVSEGEILERINFDKQGKRDAGLGGWQCRRCTKRARVEAEVVGTPALTSTRTQERQSKLPLNGHANRPTGTTSSVQPQARPSAPVEIVIVDSDEDDIIVLDDGPEQAWQSVADRRNEAETTHPPVGSESAADQQPRMSSKSPPPRQSTPTVGLDNPVKVQTTVKLSKTAQVHPILTKRSAVLTLLLAETTREATTHHHATHRVPGAVR